MFFTSIEIKTECEKCGNPVMINGPILHMLCNSCQHESEIRAMTWKSMLGDLLNDIMEAKPGEGFQSKTLADDFNRDLSAMIENPACQACGIALKGIPDKIEEILTNNCHKCGTSNEILPAPDWLTKLVPEIVLIVNASTDEPDGESERPEGKPVYFTCPSCSANLKVDGSSRLVTCQYCSSDIYLPDDLWLRMHPAETVKKWYVGFTRADSSMEMKKLNSNLLEAAYDADDDTGEELLSAGADPNTADHNDRTALFFAAAMEAEKLVRLLIDQGAKIDKADTFGTTPLNIASYNGYTGIVNFLLKKGADVNIQNKMGVTSLNAASKMNNIDIVKQLLKHGADPTIPNEDGKLPIDRAREMGNDDIVALLKKYYLSS